MSGPDGIDERFGTLMGELRSGEATASPELRERVRAISSRKPEPPAARLRGRLPRRRLTLVLVPVCALVAAAVGVGVLTSGGGGQKTALHGNAEKLERAAGAGMLAPPPRPPRPHSMAITGGQRADFTRSKSAGLNAYTPSPYAPPSGSRHQNYAVDLTMRVSNLSDTTKQAI